MGMFSDLDALATQVYGQIRVMQATGELPASLDSFDELHDWFDANVGWGDTIDNLSTPEWAALQDHVDCMLKERQ